MKRFAPFLHVIFVFGLAVGLFGPVLPATVAAQEMTISEAEDAEETEQQGAEDPEDPEESEDGPADFDEDGVADTADNCPEDYNPDQSDADGDGRGDACDGTPFGPDEDRDGILDDADNCQRTENPDQSDGDGDGDGDVCDDTPYGADADGDGVPDEADNCPRTDNPDQEDADADGEGDACDETPLGPDADRDGVPDEDDNCEEKDNADQTDSDGEGEGDACDETPNGDPPAADDVAVVYAAAGPRSYQHVRNDVGGQFGDGRLVDERRGIVGDLDGAAVACGDVVVFLQAVSVGDGLRDAPASAIELVTLFDRETTDGDAIGFAEVYDVRVNNHDIDADDDGKADDDIDDPGNHGLDGDESVRFSTRGSTDEQMRVTVVVEGLNFGERIIVRYEVLLECDRPAKGAAGDIRTELRSAEVVDDDNIDVGDQVLRIRDAGKIQDPDVAVEVACPELPDDARVGDRITYDVTIANTGTADLSELSLATSRPDGRLDRAFPSELPPGEQSIRTVVDTITEADALAGNLDLAVEAGTAEGVDDRSEAECAFAPVTRLELDVTAGGDAESGGEVVYRYNVTNSGDLPLTGVVVTDDNGTPDDAEDDLVSEGCTVASLDVGDSVRCTATRRVGADDVATGAISHTVVADADETKPVRETVSVEVAQHPALSLAVVITDGETELRGADIGQTVTVVYTVTNAGDVPLDGIALVDERIGTVTCPDEALAAGDAMTCVETDDIVETDVRDADGERLQTRGSVSAIAPSGSDVTATAATFLVVATHPALTLNARTNVVATELGARVTYAYTVGNTGDVRLSGVQVRDDRWGPIDCPATELMAGALMTCTTDHEVGRADVAAGRITTTATAESDQAAAVTDETSLAVAQHPAAALSVVFTDGEVELTIAEIGQRVEVVYTITNTGDVPLTEVALVDDRWGAIGCLATKVDAGWAMTCTATHEVTEADILDADADRLLAAAKVTATVPNGTEVEAAGEASLTVVTHPELALEVEAGETPVSVGNELSVTYTVRNAGDVGLTGVVLRDERLGAISCPTEVLAANASMACRATREVALDDVAAASLVARGTIDSDQTAPVTAETAVAVTQHPRLTLEMTATDGSSEVAQVGFGETITFVYTVQNTGDVPLDEVRLVDGRLGEIDCPAATMAVGWGVTCRATLVVGEADVRDGDGPALRMAGTVTALAPAGDTVSAGGEASLTLVARPALAVDIVPSVATANLGDTVTYSSTLRNTGDIGLTGVSLRDDRLGAINCPASTLPAGETMVCTAGGTVTAGDVAAGVVATTVTADAAEIEPVLGAATVAVAQHPSLALVVESTDGSATITSAALDQTVTFDFTVANTGDVPLADLRLVDRQLGAVACPETELAAADGAAAGPDEMTCTTTYVVAASDVVAGELERQVAASAVAPSQRQVAVNVEQALPVEAHPALALALTATDGRREISTAKIGETVTLTYQVRNTGDVALNAVAVSDARLGTVTCPATTLATGTTMSCAATLVVTEADVTGTDGAALRMAGTVTGNAPAGEAVSAADDVILRVATSPKLDLVVVPSATTAKLADMLTYTFTVHNTGDIGLTGVALTGRRLGTVPCPATTLAAGTSMTCTASTTVTTDDVAAGRIRTEVTAVADQARSERGHISVGILPDVTPLPSTPVAGTPVGATPSAPTQPPATEVAATQVPVTVIPATLPATEPPATGSPGGGDPGGNPGNEGGPGGNEGASEEVDGADCQNYTYQEDAQDAFDRDPSDPNGLDGPVGPAGHGELGKACEHLPSRVGSGNGGGSGTGSGTGGGTGSGTGSGAGTGSDGGGMGVVGGGETTSGGGVVGGSEATGGDGGAGIEIVAETPVGSPTPDAPELEFELRPNTRSANLDDDISYSYLVRNTGNVALTGVAVLDDELGTVSCPEEPFEPGAEMECEATSRLKPHKVTLEDVARGKVENEATAASDQTEPFTANASTIIEAHPEIAVDKTCPAAKETGEELTLTARLTNPGDIALGDVEAADDAGTPDDPGDDVTLRYRSGDRDRDQMLDPGETWTFDGSYTVGSSPAAEAATVTVSGTATDGVTRKRTTVSSQDACTTRIHWGDEGCSSAYWFAHQELWDGKGTSDATLTIQGGNAFNTVFAVTPAESGLGDDVTLFEATQLAGGGNVALARYAAGALASADAGIAFRYRVAEVMALYRDALGVEPGAETVDSVLAKPSAMGQLTCPSDLATRRLSTGIAGGGSPLATPVSTPVAASGEGDTSADWSITNMGEAGRLMLLGALPIFGLGGLGYRRYRASVQRRAARWR